MINTVDKKNFIWNVVGLGAYTFVSFFLLVIVKLINGISIAGVFTYSFSLCTLFFYISLYYSRTYQISNSSHSFNEYFSTRLITSLLSLFFILLFSFISGFDFNKIAIIFSLMAFRTMDAISDCFYGLLQSNDRLYQVGISYLIKSILGIVLFIVCDLLTHNLVLSILLLDGINVFVFLLYDIKNFRMINETKIELMFNSVKQIIIGSFPVFIFSFLSVYLANSQKYVITYFSSNDLQTVFGILVMPATLISLVGNYLIQPFITKFMKFLKSREYGEFNKLTFRIIGFIIGFGIVSLVMCYFVGIPILDLIYQTELIEYRLDLMLILLGSIFIAIGLVLSNIFTILNNNRIQVILYLIASIVSTITCYAFAKNNIIRGASISYLISSAVLTIEFIIVYFINFNKRKKEV